MRDCQKEPPLTYALNASDKMVYIGSVERGLSCNCRCPKCNKNLVAKPGNGGRLPHFAHQGGFNCKGSYMSALHKWAEQIIEEEMVVMVPAYKEIDKQKLEFEKIEIEQRVERKDLQPDIVGVTSDGLRWFIEIRNTHEVDEAKRAKLIESNITCLEIDVREQTLENLKSFLLESTESREWINNPIYDKKIEDSYRKKVSAIVKQFEENPKIRVPQGDDISLQNLCVSVSEDGLYAGIKAVSSSGIPYLFHIGNHEGLEHIEPTRESNELLVDVDRNQSVNELYLERLYLYIPKKDAEEEIEEYKSNPKYELRPTTDCYSKCEYSPFLEKCIYSKATVSQHGVDYVVCNKGKRQKDEAGVSSRNKISDSRLSSNTSFERLNDEPQKDSFYTKFSPIKPKHETTAVPPQSDPSPDALPFDRFWTIEEYYSQLQSTGSYETEKGYLADIVKCDKTNSGILLLYRDPSEVRTFTPFHIVIIKVTNGNLTRKEVGVYTNEKVALNKFNERLYYMKKNDHSEQPTEQENNDVPF